VKVYRETGGEVGHNHNGVPALILETTGKTSGKTRASALYYATYGDAFVVIASKGGAPEAPAWYDNLTADPRVTVQVGPDVFPARARTATGEERSELWSRATQVWPDYDVYQTRTTREIPVVVLERDE
jgi:deazaflavin-dependent oxidoreductase (nitroreductase family)